ncbi:MAG TPA: large conductance mechanosensitive channel protein MscL [Thermoplasmata archaeon]|nr:large conductance mechanosensitive channel protein MscL [Thermoplasmata archaeon]
MSAWDDFKAFITKGNVIDLAVAVVIGLAFQAVVTAFVMDIISPLIGIPGSHDFSGYSYKLGGGTFLYGAFITAIINFLLIALVVYFVLVRPVAQIDARRKARQAAAPPTTRDCPACLSKVPIKATRCAYCTSDLPPA